MVLFILLAFVFNNVGSEDIKVIFHGNIARKTITQTFYVIDSKKVTQPFM